MNNDTRKISLCLTTYNRSDLVVRAISQIINHPNIDEIVIVDDASEEYHYQQLKRLLVQVGNPKVKLYRNQTNADCYKNKKISVELASNEWVIIFDSDNIINDSYIDKLLTIQQWDSNTIYAPSFAKPHFNYTSFNDIFLYKGNIGNFSRATGFDALINTCNYFVNKENYILVHNDLINPHAADTCYFNLCWIKAGFTILVVPGLEYQHMVHDGSHYKEHNHKSNDLFIKLIQEFQSMPESSFKHPKLIQEKTVFKSTVTFTPMGRMGNFLFEAAAALAYALKHGLDFSPPSQTNDPKWNPIYLQHAISINYVPGKQDILLKEQTYFKYDPLEFKEEWKYDRQIVLSGYFQNPKYFEQYRAEIIRLFSGFIDPQYNTCSIHIRRGDYLQYPDKHPPFSDNYITNAIDYIKSKTNINRFIVFSDDIPWCRSYFSDQKFESLQIEYSEGKTEQEDMAGMANCEHNINSSSTFSWWGSWLNTANNKIVITPKIWLLHKHANEWTDEIIPKEWIKI